MQKDASVATTSSFALRILPSLIEDVKALATQNAVSVNQFLVQVAAEKVAVLKARGYLLQPSTVHSDTHDQSAPIFGLRHPVPGIVPSRPWRPG